MPTCHPDKLTPADDGSVNWTLAPSRNKQFPETYGHLDANIRVYERGSAIGENVHLSINTPCSYTSATLSPEEAEALGAALLLAAGQARDNADSQQFLDQMHEQLANPEYDRAGVIYVHPQVHYCHPDDFAAQSKQLPAGHTLIADEMCARSPLNSHEQVAA